MTNLTRKSPSGENTGRWTKEEHGTFLDGLRVHGKEWKKIAAMIETRTVVQIRTHAQKYFQKLAKTRESQGKEVPGDLVSTASNPRNVPDRSRRPGSSGGPGSRRTASMRRQKDRNTPGTGPYINTASPDILKTLLDDEPTRMGSPTRPASSVRPADAKRPATEALGAVASGPASPKRAKQAGSALSGPASPSRPGPSAAALKSSPIAPTSEPAPAQRPVADSSAALLLPKKRTVSKAAASASQQSAPAHRKLTISTALSNAPFGNAGSSMSEREAHVMRSRDEEDLKWLVSMSARMPDASPTAVSDFAFYQDFDNGDDLFLPMTPTPEEDEHAISSGKPSIDRSALAAQPSPGARKSLAAVVDADSDAASHLAVSEAQSLEEWISSSETSGSIDGTESDLLSVEAASDCDGLDHPPELTEMGPFTKFVFGDDGLEDSGKRAALAAGF